MSGHSSGGPPLSAGSYKSAYGRTISISAVGNAGPERNKPSPKSDQSAIMQWLAWKPLCLAGVLLGGGGWYGYHHYRNHFHHDGGDRFDHHDDHHDARFDHPDHR